MRAGEVLEYVLNPKHDDTHWQIQVPKNNMEVNTTCYYDLSDVQVVVAELSYNDNDVPGKRVVLLCPRRGIIRYGHP